MDTEEVRIIFEGDTATFITPGGNQFVLEDGDITSINRRWFITFSLTDPDER